MLIRFFTAPVAVAAGGGGDAIREGGAHRRAQLGPRQHLEAPGRSMWVDGDSGRENMLALRAQYCLCHNQGKYTTGHLTVLGSGGVDGERSRDLFQVQAGLSLAQLGERTTKTTKCQD